MRSALFRQSSTRSSSELRGRCWRGATGSCPTNGHLRHAALSDLGHSEAPCLIADDDEAFTYNKRVNRLATIQEHYMIVKAIERGVSEEKLARALNVDIKRIKTKRTLLDGVCPEVAEMHARTGQIGF